MKVVKKIQITAIFMIILLLVQLMIPMMNISEAAIVISQDGQWNYEIIDYGEDSGKARLVYYNDTSATTLTVPSQIDGIQVKQVSGAIGSNHDVTEIVFSEGITYISWVENIPNLQNVILPQSLKTIDGNSFSDCPKLRNISLPSNLTKITNQCFANCTSLQQITIPGNVKTIGEIAFKGCTGLTSVTMEEGVTSLGSGAFEGCTNLRTINIPSTLDDNSMYIAFGNCMNLKNISVNANNPNYTTSENVLFNKDKTKIIKYAPGKEEIFYTVPNTVTKIEIYAFSYATNLKTITFPNTMQYINWYAFKGCTNLNEITLPTIEKVSIGSFTDCTNLKKVIIQEGTTEIESEAFKGCTNLSEISIPDSVTKIDKTSFDNNINAIIKCNSGSYAETYAKGYEIDYVLNNEELIVNDIMFAMYPDTTFWYTAESDSNKNINIIDRQWPSKHGVKVAITGNMTLKADGWSNEENEKVGYGHIEKLYTQNTREQIILKSVDGTKTKTITIDVRAVDTEIPVVSAFIQVTHNSMKITADVYDKKKMPDICNYAFYIKKESEPDSAYVKKGSVNTGTYQSSSNSYSYAYSGNCTITDLEPDTKYVVKIETSDYAGNVVTFLTGTKTDVPDTTSPSCTITTNPSSSPTNANSITYIFTFNEDVTGFTADDIIVTNGTKGIFSGTGKVYTLVVTNSGSCTQTIELNANKCTDMSNNANLAASKTVVIDKAQPSCTITTNPSVSQTNTNSITYTFTFNKDVTGFTIDDIEVTNGTKGTFSGSGKIYTLVVTNSGSCTQTVTLAADKCNDIAGNGNVATNKTVVIDTVAPTVAFGTNGRATYGKTASTTVTVSDIGDSGVDANSLKYKWTQSTTVPEENTFSEKFTNGGTITKSEGTGNNWYLWILAKDTVGNIIIQKSNVFYLDNTAPIITGVENGKVYTNTQVTITLTDEEINTIKLTKDGQEVTDFVSGSTLTQKGKYEIAATDKSGNKTIVNFSITEKAQISTNSYIIKNLYIEKISPNTTVKNIINGITSNLAYEIKNKDGIKLEETQIVATGCKMVFSSVEEYELVVKGDLNGDGKVSITDLAKIKKQVVGNADLIGAYKEAADVNIDTKITATDLLQVKKSIVGLIIL